MRVLLLIAALLCVVSAKAQDRLVSIDAFDLGYAGGLLFQNDDGADRKDRNANDFRLRLNYAQKMPEWHEALMLKGIVRVERRHEDAEADTTNSVWAASGGALYNFDPADTKNSAFVGGQFGLEWMTIEDAADEDSGINMVFSVEGGKRWDMGEFASAMISYAPSIEAAYRRYGGDIRETFYKSGTEFKLSFLKFDIMF